MNNCPNCAPYDCYHICPNSPHYYSAEQERYDDAMDDGSDDRRERYASEMADIDLMAERDDEEYADEEDLFGPGDPIDDLPSPFVAVGLIVVDTSDDLPF